MALSDKLIEYAIAMLLVGAFGTAIITSISNMTSTDPLITIGVSLMGGLFFIGVGYSVYKGLIKGGK